MALILPFPSRPGKGRKVKRVFFAFELYSNAKNTLKKHPYHKVERGLGGSNLRSELHDLNFLAEQILALTVTTYDLKKNYNFRNIEMILVQVATNLLTWPAAANSFTQPPRSRQSRPTQKAFPRREFPKSRNHTRPAFPNFRPTNAVRWKEWAIHGYRYPPRLQQDKSP